MQLDIQQRMVQFSAFQLLLQLVYTANNEQSNCRILQLYRKERTNKLVLLGP